MFRTSLLIVTLFLSLTISGCGTTRVFTDLELDYPPRKPLPTVEASEVKCLSEATVKTLDLRQTILTTRINLLEDIIDSTKGNTE